MSWDEAFAVRYDEWSARMTEDIPFYVELATGVRLDLRETDMRDLHLDEQAALIYCPFRALLHLARRSAEHATMLELRQLRHFVAVAEELSFTRAARKIPLAQSALSTSVRSLERALHTELFKRTGHSVTLTASGEVMLVEARKILRAVDEAQDAVAEVEGGMRGTVRLGILQALAFSPITDLLLAFREQRPHVRLEVRVEPRGSFDLLHAVQQNRLDVAFVTIPGETPVDVDVLPLATAPLAVVVPRDHRLAGQGSIAIDELAGEAFVDYPPGWGIRRKVEQVFEARGLDREIAVEVGDSQTACALALCGLGVAFVVPSTVPSFEDVLHSTEPAVDLEISLVSSRKPASRIATKAFVDLVADSVRADP
jgi:DNA-binding transcriptional LysR family regulator